MYPLLLSDFNTTLKFLNRFSKNSRILNFMKICPVGAEWLYAKTEDERTGKYDKANSPFFFKFCETS